LTTLNGFAVEEIGSLIKKKTKKIELQPFSDYCFYP